MLVKEVGRCSNPLHPDTFYKTIKDQATVSKPGGKIKIKFPIKPDALYLNVTNTNEESVEIGKAEQYSYALPASPGY
ncbi:hypothetical protein [Paenibacillus sp. FSL K6-2859]|uniref:hypothetical protein n=1 Tax=Paenibacillus sp. FSL K6-2859 TaxID=2921482 RepID=UPI0030F8942E